jgi:O-glycosyl hydrolase
MGAQVARVIIEKADWEAANDNADPLVFNDSYYTQVYSTAKFTDLWSTISYLNSKGVTVSLAVMGAAPDWMGGSDLTPGREAEYAELVASLVRFARLTRGLNVRLVEPFNELEWDGKEGVRASAQQAVQVLQLLGRRLDTLGLGDVRFVTPDSASVATGVGTYLPALLADPYVAGKIAHVGLHDYSGSTGGAAGAIAASPRPGTDVWMTEFSAWCPGCDSGAPNPADWPFARQTGQYLLSMMSQGAAGAIVWDGVDSFYEHHASVTYWGMLSGGGGRGAYQPRTTFSVMAQVMRYVATGSRLLTSSTDDPALDVAAFHHPASGRLTVVGFNLSGAAKTLTINLTGLSGYQSLNQVQTNASTSLAPAGSVAVTTNQITVSVPADTMFTLTGTGARPLYVLPFGNNGMASLDTALGARTGAFQVVPINRQAGTFAVPGCSTVTSPMPLKSADATAMIAGSAYVDVTGRTVGPLPPDCRPDATTLASEVRPLAA